MSIPAVPRLIQEPTVGEVRKAEVGDTLVKTAKVTEFPALYLRQEVLAKGKGNAAGNRLKLVPGLYPGRFEDATRTCFASPTQIEWWNFMTHGRADAWICVMKANPAAMEVLAGSVSLNAVYQATTPMQVERATFVDKQAPGFWQELIYNGRSGTTARFLYREFANESARPAFDQQVEFDLSAGATVGFKGARIEVIEATNTEIRYKVLAHFPVPNF